METLKDTEAREKAVFVAVLAHAAQINGVTDSEVEFIKDIAHNFALDEVQVQKASEPRNEIETIALLKYIVNPKTKLELVRELFFLGYADGNLSNEEVLFVSKVGNALSLSIETIEKISDWVIRGIEWEEEGEEIFSL